MNTAVRDRVTEPPLVRGWPLVGNVLGLLRDPIAFFRQQYQQVGPAFRVAVMGKTFTVIAGPEANIFMSRTGDQYLRNRPVFGPLVEELGGHDVIVAMDGSAHRQGRRVLKPVFTRDAIAAYVPQMTAIAQEHARRLQLGERIDVVDLIRRLVVEQTGLTMAGRSGAERFEDISRFFVTLVRVTVAHRDRPRAFQKPAYVEAKTRVFDFMHDLIAEHRQRQTPPEEWDAIDHLLAATDEHGQPIAEGDLLASSLLPFFGGIDTVANTTAFLIYALLRHPAVLDQVIAEVDAAFAAGPLTVQRLRAMPVLHGAALETLRMYPVAPSAQRYVAEPFEFEGYHIPADQMIVVGTTVAHSLPHLFPEPQRFDITRYEAPRNEHRQAGAFAPFGNGPHTCLGAGLAEAQTMLIAAALLRTVRLELDPPSYHLRTVIDPVPTAKGLFARVVERRETGA